MGPRFLLRAMISGHGEIDPREGNNLKFLTLQWGHDLAAMENSIIRPKESQHKISMEAVVLT